MTAWYYQCSAGAVDRFGRKYEDDFRVEIREWSDVAWPGLGPHSNKFRVLTPGLRPATGDPLLVGYAKTGARRPGVVAVGLVLQEREESLFSWRPLPPTASLLLRPLWDADIEKRINAIRGGMASLTCYEVSARDEDYLMARVARWVGTGK